MHFLSSLSLASVRLADAIFSVRGGAIQSNAVHCDMKYRHGLSQVRLR